ncbi:ABC-type transport auxiliary lipoprotein family protein [Desulfovibrio sp. OttesenSCG-928-G11]|nr:ABC-type transport auxiliary lipoprotein family protein [Desulfovibrio sp. OttesenSCG-928-G11]
MTANAAPGPAQKRRFAPASRLAPALALLAALLVSCTACALVSPGPPPSRLQLHPALPAPLAAGPAQKQVIVAMPGAGRELESDAIALVFHGREVRHLAGARWTGSVPGILQRFFVEAIESSRAAAGVSDDVTGLVANARLLSDIKAFGLEYADEKRPPRARFAATFRLLDLYSGKMLAVHSIDNSLPASGNDAVALAAACEKVLEKSLAELAAWTGSELRRAK